MGSPNFIGIIAAGLLLGAVIGLVMAAIVVFIFL